MADDNNGIVNTIMSLVFVGLFWLQIVQRPKKGFMPSFHVFKISYISYWLWIQIKKSFFQIGIENTKQRIRINSLHQILSIIVNYNFSGKTISGIQKHEVWTFSMYNEPYFRVSYATKIKVGASHNVSSNRVLARSEDDC